MAYEEPKCEYVQFLQTKPRLFFVGRLDYYSNYLGIDHFIECVWPSVLKEVPDAELQVAGKVYAPEVVTPYFDKWNSVQGVKVLGFLESLDDAYAQCRATISPIYVGAGTNIKLLESLQRKRVSVTTECGMRGMSGYLSINEDLLVAKNDEDYAQLVVRALTDEVFNKQIAKNGYEKNMRHFSHASFNKIIAEILK